MTIAEYRALIGKKKPHKYGAVAVTDPETGTRIPSKHEARVLAQKRLEADAQGWITALHPRFKIEGGHYSADLVQIEIDFDSALDRNDGWVVAMVRFVDAKGKMTPASRRSIKAVRERYGVDVQIVKNKERP